MWRCLTCKETIDPLLGFCPKPECQDNVRAAKRAMLLDPEDSDDAS
jgi:hypothetical protein